MTTPTINVDRTPEEEEAFKELTYRLTAGRNRAPTQPIPADAQMELFPELVASSEGRKFDSGKMDYTLLPFEAVDEIVKVLMFGAQKYERDNWRKVGNAKQRYAAAAFRHLTAHIRGEANDEESGLPHLAHLGCCVLFMLALEKSNGA